MRLTDLQLKALTKMIETSSTKKMKEYKEKNAKELKHGIVFAGDSMVDYFPFNEHLETYSIVNRGIAGATTQSFLDTFDTAVLPLEPKVLFISIGSNDLVMFNATADEAIKNIKHLLDVVKEKLPNTKIYYLSTTPVISEEDKIYKILYVGGRTNQEQQKINDAISRYHRNFINVYDALVDGQGYLEIWYTADGIHLNRYGYAAYAKVLKPYLDTIS